MVFQIKSAARLDRAGVNVLRWELVKADGTVVCHSGGLFDSEKEARSDIAEAKRAFAGTRRCRVEVV